MRGSGPLAVLYRLVPVLAMAALLVPCHAHAQGTTRLLGRVVDLRGEPVRDVRLRIVGHGEPEVFDSGEFELELSGQPDRVEVDVVGTEMEVLYPLGGDLPIPQDESVRVPVVVDKPERDYISDLLAARFVQLEATLARNGVRYDATVDSLGEGMRRIIDLLELREADLRENIEMRKKQTDVKPALLRTVDDYVLEVKDLRDAFRLVAPHAAENRELAVTLQTAMLEYNEAFEALNNNRNAFLSGIRSFWDPARAEGLERDLADVYTEAIEEIHKAHMLPLNDALVVLQRAHSNDRPSDGEIDAAVREALETADELDTRIDILEVRYARLREALERG